MNITTIYIVVKEFCYRGSVHLIAFAPECKRYLAIDRTLIDANGHLIRELNGMQMHMCDTLTGTIASVKDKIDIEKLMEEGMTKAQAICKVANLEYNPELENILV